MTDEPRLPSLDDACTAGLEAAEAVSDPVDRLLALVELADRAAAVVREIDAATGRAVRRALTTMSLDDLSDRLHRSAGDVLFLPAAYISPGPEAPDSGHRPDRPGTSAG